jgi:hypothetical protein
MSASTSIPPLQRTASTVALTNSINDRLRRISTALANAQGTTGKTGAPGPPGTSATGSGSSAAAFTIGVSGGAAKPDLSKSTVQRVVLAAPTNLVVPANRPHSGVMFWALLVENPTTGALVLTPDATYGITTLIQVVAATRATLWLVTTQSGNTVLLNSLFKQPILTV